MAIMFDYFDAFLSSTVLSSMFNTQIQSGEITLILSCISAH